MTPHVSVVVPVRNRRALLIELLDALAAQTYRDFEIVVVDDGSTDGSGAAAETHLGVGGRVRVVRTPGVGAVAARQRGVEAAGGEVLAFTDSDCVPEPGWLAAGVAAVDAGADVVQGSTRPRRECRAGERSLWVGDEPLYPTCNVFYRRSAFDAAGGFDLDAGRRFGFRPGSGAKGLGFGEDTLLGWRVRRLGSAAYRPEAAVLHQVLPTGFTEQLSRALLAGAFPALVREVPELRSTFLEQRVLLGTSRLPLYGALAAIALRRRVPAAVLLAWWVARHWRSSGTTEPSRAAPPRRVVEGLALDAVTAGALLAGSVRARRIVL